MTSWLRHAFLFAARCLLKVHLRCCIIRPAWAVAQAGKQLQHLPVYCSGQLWLSHRLADWHFQHALQEQQLAQIQLQSSAKQKFIANLRAKLENAEMETEQLKYKLQQK